MAARLPPSVIKEMRPMDDSVIARHFESLDRRLARVEQILPTLATKEELQAAIAPLATREELHEEGERSRRYMKILIEDQNSKIELLAEHVLSLTAKRTEE
jgi:hypothetical protein